MHFHGRGLRSGWRGDVLPLLVFLQAVALFAADWPQWRGPTRDGVASECPPLAETWPEDGPPLVWESEEIPSGQSGNLSSLVVADGKVFVYVNWHRTEPIQTRTLSVSVLRKLGWYPQTLPAELEAAVESARVSAQRVKLSRDELAPMIDAWLAAKGVEGAVRKALLAQVPTSEKLSDDVVLCLDAATGKTLWRTQASGNATGWNFSSTPCVDRGKLYLLMSGGEAVCMETQKGEVLWRTLAPEAKNVSSSFLVADGLAVILAGPLIAFDIATGETKWTQPKISGSNPSPLLADSKVIGVLDNYASLAMWKATPGAYTELAKVRLATAACTSPALADGKLYLRLKEFVACHDLRATAVL